MRQSAPSMDHQTLFVQQQQWQIEQRGSELIVTGGADARYSIELGNETLSFFANIGDKPFVRAEVPSAEIPVLEELLTAAIIQPVLPLSATLKYALIGDDSYSLPDQEQLARVKRIAAADVAIIVRTHGTYGELLRSISYEELHIPHLLVDTAFHHTVSLGPLVFPGETACLACLEGRIGNRWGDTDTAPSPRATTRYRDIVAALVAEELLRIHEGDMSLVGKTVSWNVLDRTVSSNQLLKVPLCPICSKNAFDPSEPLALP